MSDVIAVNVAIVGPALDDVVLPASNLVCSDSIGTPCEYLLCPLKLDGTPAPVGRAYAHVTLAQLFCRQERIAALATAVAVAVGEAVSHSKGAGCPLAMRVGGGHAGPVFATIGGVSHRLPSLLISKTCSEGMQPSFVQTLHELLASNNGGAFSFSGGPADAECNKSSCFSSSWPGNEASVRWVEQYATRSSGRVHYFPHVTLGCSSRDDSVSTLSDTPPVDISLKDLFVVVSWMGNFCSCNTVLVSIPILED